MTRPAFGTAACEYAKVFVRPSPRKIQINASLTQIYAQIFYCTIAWATSLLLQRCRLEYAWKNTLDQLPQAFCRCSSRKTLYRQTQLRVEHDLRTSAPNELDTRGTESRPVALTVLFVYPPFVRENVPLHNVSASRRVRLGSSPIQSTTTPSRWRLEACEPNRFYIKGHYLQTHFFLAVESRAFRAGGSPQT